MVARKFGAPTRRSRAIKEGVLEGADIKGKKKVKLSVDISVSDENGKTVKVFSSSETDTTESRSLRVKLMLLCHDALEALDA
jgi:hypothetical protein